MKLHNKIFCFLAVFAMVFVSAAPEDVVKAAQQGMHSFLNSIPEAMLSEYGFDSEEELEQCQLGAPFQLKTITPNKLRSYNINDTVQSMTKDTGVWYFTIVCSGENKTILSVAKIDNQWQAVSLGNIPLANQLQSIESTWAQNRGFSPQIIVVYQAQQYFFHIPQLNENNLTAIQLRTKQAIDYHYVGAMDTIAKDLWQEVQKNMEPQRKFEEIANDNPTSFNATRKVLNLPQKYQKYNQWCWAGCSEAIFNYFNKNVQQERIAQEGTRGQNIWNWLWGVTNNPYRKGIRELLSTWGLRSYGLNNRLSYNDLQSEIAANKPVVVRWGWDNGGGHFVVCKGLSGNTSYIMDPWSGPTINSYNWLCRGNGHTWTSTLKVSR
ncbi:papain-like cysteine protease family protein [Candidatus Uabimicrobium sp. HlEnr_7]|uniref:papain-like cysteine protease family protein n=1 Tax=Candidatus Uabimicrobium helgolandensis TaxID=3095367 RepID=UPI0035580A05